MVLQIKIASLIYTCIFYILLRFWSYGHLSGHTVRSRLISLDLKTLSNLHAKTEFTHERKLK